MAYGRREIAPKEQIKALRHARDHYVQLADRIHNDTESTLDAAEKQLREDDARRIAKAYERSLSNSVARLSGLEGTHKLSTQSFGLRSWIGVLLIVAMAGLLPFAYRHTRDGFLKLREIGTVALNAAKSAPPASIPPPAVIEQNPLPEKPEAPKNLGSDAHKPAIAMAVPAPRKIAQPRSPEAGPREATNAKPAVTRQAVQIPAETATASTPAPAQPVTLAPAPPPPAPILPPAPLPAPAEMPAPPVVAAIPPPAAVPPVPPAIRPEPIMETHTLPRYPSLSAQTGEAGTTRMSVAISPQGQASDCRITQSSGSERLDSTACAHVTDHWRWKPVNRDSTAPTPRISVTMVWNLSRPSR